MASFRAGDRVVHPKRPEWGVGQVVGAPAGDKVKALFAKGGVRTVLAGHLEPAPPEPPKRKARPPW